MKIGIVTFHRANNLGAVLQTFALFRYIKNRDVDCEIIDFVPNNQISKDFMGIRKILRTIKMFFRYLKNGFKTPKNKIENFRKHQFVLSSDTYYGDKGITRNPPAGYDVIISGSDQIFNTTLTGNSKGYYLDFPTDAIKVSYASSFGRTDITDEEKALIRSELPKFRCLSCREQDGIDIINKETELLSDLVADPSFLLDASQWEMYCGSPILTGRYIFVYAMEYSDYMDRTIRNVREQYQLPVYILCGSVSAEKLSGERVFDYGVEDFLAAIKNAEYVVTNSFHGTAFSIIFEKKFFCVSHSTRNSRLENIMDIAENSDKLISQSSAIDNINSFLIDGKMCYELLTPLIEQSKMFLTKILSER